MSSYNDDPLRGEYTYDGSYLKGTNVDVDDSGHEGTAIECLAGSIKDDFLSLYDDCGLENYNRYRKDFNNDEYVNVDSLCSLISELEDFLNETDDVNLKNEINQLFTRDKKVIQAVCGSADPLALAAELHGLVFIRDGRFDLYGWGLDKVKEVVNLANEIIESNSVEDDLSSEDIEIGVYDYKTGKGYNYTLAELKSGNLFKPMPNNLVKAAKIKNFDPLANPQAAIANKEMYRTNRMTQTSESIDDLNFMAWFKKNDKKPIKRKLKFS